jgi:hypothetical protein
MNDASSTNARTELQSWYLRSLLPKLERAAGAGAVDPGAIAALDADLRALLELSQGREEAA